METLKLILAVLIALVTGVGCVTFWSTQVDGVPDDVWVWLGSLAWSGLTLVWVELLEVDLDRI